MKILLVGNHPGDRIESMEKFAALLAREIARQGHETRIVAPTVLFRKRKPVPFPGSKWLYYFDKYILFPFRLRKEIQWADIVHIGDQGLGILIHFIHDKPHLITCHDLLCIRSLYGENVYCRISATGKIYQRLILSGLRKAGAIVAVSKYTLNDVRHFLTNVPAKRVRVIHNGLNHPYHPIPKEEIQKRLRYVLGLQTDLKYILHVGTSLERKNRATILRTFHKISSTFSGQLVFAGEKLTKALVDLAVRLGIKDRIVEVVHPENEILEALYNGSFVFFFPSFSEGFGWPVIEAQACGIPVLCSDIPPLREIGGKGAIFCPPEDDNAFAIAIKDLLSSKERWMSLSKAALENARQFSSEAMASSYLKFYLEILDNPTMPSSIFAE
ncbi:glycosyltransferase family 4 protein [Methylacidiphilum caldifontis]|uniref:Glycosyl transferase n=1 Tax=Methylacidiphilum caldifontis TaxID=2795386 RepID=A0A4Y8P8K0_9BACT|nr:glycosyltransferase family 1 protein [Methylacidiphilum caldifontis]TFE66577.1 hypothetical protein A7Q10_02035 [Methylacidiphilum caldifontis]